MRITALLTLDNLPILSWFSGSRILLVYLWSNDYTPPSRKLSSEAVFTPLILTEQKTEVIQAQGNVSFQLKAASLGYAHIFFTMRKTICLELKHDPSARSSCRATRCRVLPEETWATLALRWATVSRTRHYMIA